MLQTVSSRTSATHRITDIAVIAIVSTVNEIGKEIDRTLQAGSYTELKLRFTLELCCLLHDDCHRHDSFIHTP